jgi:hypothetical protein
MSTLLEQAIVDAKALKEAALKNAETSILQKYGSEVKLTVESLLEQELDDPFAMPPEEEEMGLEGEPPVGIEADVPFGAAEGEKMCSCPDEGEETTMTLNLNDLQSMAEELDGEFGEQMPQEELMGDLGMEPAEEDIPGAPGAPGEFEEFEDEEDELDLDALMESLQSDEVEEELYEAAELDEETELDEAAIKELVEELVVDISNQKTGWLATPEPHMHHAEEVELARLASTEAQEKVSALKDARERLTVTNESLGKKNKKLSKTIYALNKELQKLILENAKLLYSNQTLNSTSLNERQKTQIVESIQTADSVEEAKVIYETLQSAVGSDRKVRKKPQSLREAIRKPSSLTMPRREKRTPKRETVLKERFQRLAGIK